MRALIYLCIVFLAVKVYGGVETCMTEGAIKTAIVKELGHGEITDDEDKKTGTYEVKKIDLSPVACSGEQCSTSFTDLTVSVNKEDASLTYFLFHI